MTPYGAPLLFSLLLHLSAVALDTHCSRLIALDFPARGLSTRIFFTTFVGDSRVCHNSDCIVAEMRPRPDPDNTGVGKENDDTLNVQTLILGHPTCQASLAGQYTLRVLHTKLMKVCRLFFFFIWLMQVTINKIPHDLPAGLATRGGIARRRYARPHGASGQSPCHTT